MQVVIYSLGGMQTRINIHTYNRPHKCDFQETRRTGQRMPGLKIKNLKGSRLHI